MIFMLTYLPNYHFKLILSQGNACVESGFATNEQLLEADIKEQSSVARRIVYEGVSEEGGILKVDIRKKMLADVKNPGDLLTRLKKKTGV